MSRIRLLYRRPLGAGLRLSLWQSEVTLALAFALLLKADIFYSTGTNHLGAPNTAWSGIFLSNLTHCTYIIVYHNSGIPNNTIINVLHLNRFKLARCKGNAKAFVVQIPPARFYYTLEAIEDYDSSSPTPSP